MTEPFALKPGAVVLVPSREIVIGKSAHGERFSATPMICRLRREGRGERTRYSFMRSDDDEIRVRQTDGEVRGFILFVPVGVREGEHLVVEWVDRTCACARRATKDKVLNATASGEAGAWTV